MVKQTKQAKIRQLSQIMMANSKLPNSKLPNSKPNKFDIMQANMQKSGKNYKQAEMATAQLEKFKKGK